MQVRLLGPVDVTLNGVARPVSGLRRKAVLAALALRPGEVVSTDRLTDVVWGPGEAGSVNTLQSHVSYLRRVFGDKTAIVSRSPGYQLNLADDPTDVVVAERLIEQGGRSADADGAAQLRAALALWRGRPLVDITDLPWFDEQAQRLERLRLVAVERLVEARLALGEAAGLVPELETLVQQHPFQETLHRHLMIALYRSNRQQEALAAYRRLRDLLDEELGITPSAIVRDLHAAILRQDPELDLPKQAISVAQPGPVTPVPAQLPLAAFGFVGRRAELARLDAVLATVMEPAAPVVISAVSGMPGVGKTTLAVHWAHRAAAHFPDGQLYVNLRGFDPGAAPLDPNVALRGFLDAFGVPAARIPTDIDGRAALYRSVLAARRVLVLLDNAKDADQVRPLLPGSAGCRVIVTSRNNLTPLVAAEGAQPLVLNPLTDEESYELLAARIGADRTASEPEAIQAILQRCARLPLALAVAGGGAASAPGLPLATVAAQLREAYYAVDALSGGDAATDVNDVFTWSYRMLSRDAARLLRLLGLHAGPEFATAAAASLGGVTIQRARALLVELARSNLLVERHPDRYTIHDLLQAFAARQSAQEESADDRRAAVRRLLDHYLYAAHAAALLVDPARTPVVTTEPPPGVTVPIHADHERALSWFAVEHAALTAAIELAARHGFDRHCWQLAWTMTTSLDWHGHWDDLVVILRAALAALRRLDDRAGAAQTHRDLGRILAQLGRHAEAAGHLDEALALYRELGDDAGQARTHHSIGWLMLAQHRYQEALSHCEQEVTLFARAGDRLWQARALNANGWVHAQLGEHRRAMDLCLQALALQQAGGDRHGEAGTWDTIGYAHHHLGELPQAIDCYRRAVDIFQELGDTATEAGVLLHLGDSQHAAGDTDAARDSWQRALSLLEAIDHPEAQQARARLGS